MSEYASNAAIDVEWARTYINCGIFEDSQEGVYMIITNFYRHSYDTLNVYGLVRCGS